MTWEWFERNPVAVLYLVVWGGPALLAWLIASGRGPLAWRWEPDGGAGSDMTPGGETTHSGRLRLRNIGSYPLTRDDHLEAPLMVRPPEGGRLLAVRPDQTADFDIGPFVGAQDEAGAEISFDFMCPREWACFRVDWEGPAGASPVLEGRLIGTALLNANSFRARVARLFVWITWLREVISRVPNRLSWRYAKPRTEGSGTVPIRFTSVGLGALKGSYHLARPLVIRCREAGRVNSARVAGRSSPAVQAEILPGVPEEGVARLRLGSLNQGEWVLVEVDVENPAFFARPTVEGKLPGTRLTRYSEESTFLADVRRSLTTMSLTAQRAVISGAVALLVVVASEQVAALVPWPALWAMRALAVVCAVAAFMPLFGFGCHAVSWQYDGAAPPSGDKRGLHGSEGYLTLLNVGRAVLCEGQELTAPLTIAPPRDGRLLSATVAAGTSPHAGASVVLLNQSAAEVRFQRLAPEERITVAVTYEGPGDATPTLGGSLNGAALLREPDRGSVSGLAQWLVLNLWLGLATERRVLSWGRRIVEDPSPAAVLLRVTNAGNRVLRADCELSKPMRLEVRLGGRLVSAWIAGASSPEMQAELRNCDEHGVDLVVGSLQPRQWVHVGASFDPPVMMAVPGLRARAAGMRVWRFDQMTAGGKVGIAVGLLYMVVVSTVVGFGNTQSPAPALAHYPPDASNWTVLGVCCGLALFGLLATMFRKRPRPGGNPIV